MYWYPTWVSPIGIPQKKLTSYYTEKPRLLRRHARVYKQLEDIIIEVAKRRKPYSKKTNHKRHQKIYQKNY
jgi:hypothetical protein